MRAREKNLYDEIVRAAERIRPLIPETELRGSPLLSGLGGGDVYLKLENLQVTGSFKVRGAMNKTLSLPDRARAKGVVTASTGNHGAAVAYCLHKIGGRGVVYVHEGAEPWKVNAIRGWGAEVRVHGADAVAAEARAREVARIEELAYISPYNDPRVIAGQGTIGVEIARQLAGLAAVIAPVGGGGLVSGIGAYLKRVDPAVEMIGCSPENSKVMIESVRAGRILELPSLPTLSDATAGGVEPGSITFDLCRNLVDSFVTVTENEIRRAMLEFRRSHGMTIEGAAAVAVASYVKESERCAGRKVVVVISGGNIDPDRVRRIE